MDSSQKLLQELSNLTRNLDVLTKEVKESNKINTESQKIFSKNIENNSSKITPQTQTPTGTKKKEEIFGRTEKFLKEKFSGLKDKEAGFENTNFNPGQEVKNLISSVAEKLIKVPKLEDGGRVTKNGVAMVGEKGPELVELKKSNTVNSNDKIMELMKMEMEDRKKEKGSSEASKVITGNPKLNDFVTNSYGVKVPQKEIDSARKDFEKESEGDPDYVKEEIEAFIESYRDSVTAESQKISSAMKSIEPKKLEEPPKEKKVGTFEKLKSKLTKEKNPDKTPSAESVSQTPKLTEGERIKEEFKKSYEGSALGKTVAGVKSLAKKFKEEKGGKSEMKKEEQNLKSESSKGSTPTPPAQDKGPSGKTESKSPESDKTSTPAAASTPSSGSSASTPSGSGASPKDKKSDGGISQQDIQDIKALLSAINTTLNGPLNVKDNKPFRPKSNMLE